MRATHNNGRKTADPVDALRDDLAAIRKDISAIVGGRMSALGGTVTDTFDEVRKTGTRLAVQGRRAAGAAHARLSKTAGSRPLTVIAVSAAAGIIGAKMLGWMWRR